MPRGRHRISPPLHRLLPPSTVAGFATAVAVLAWFAPVGDRGLVLRVLVAVAAAAGCVGAVLLRRWDRAAGQQVADLKAARARDEWRAEERIAEVEGDLEESRELRHRLDGELRAKRAELARLRGEHAALLRRYATAETERARALESRRRLAIEASTAPRAIAPPTGRPTPAAYQRAAEALRNLPRNAARQQAMHTVEAARRREAAADEGDEPHGRHGHAPSARDPGTAGPPGREHLVPAVAAAVVPYTPPRPVRTQGGFDFFGVHKGAAGHDPADEASRGARRPSARPSGVVDLTAHDDTEHLDARALRAGS